MSASHLIHIRTAKNIDYGAKTSPVDSGDALNRIENLVAGVKSGTIAADCVEALVNQTAAEHACAFSLCSTSSGTLTTTVNGTAITASGAGTDTADALAIATAVNAATAAKGLVIANTNVCTVALTSVAVGDVIQIAGVKFTAAAATSSTDNTVFAQITSDTATALSLSTIINAHPVVGLLVRTQPVAGVLYIGARPNITLPTCKSFADTMVVTNGTFAATYNVFYWCPVPGLIGNAVTIAASGTGHTLAAGTKLVSGAGIDEQTAADCINALR